MELIIKKDQIKDWLAVLKKDFKVIDTRKNILPPKQYFFPSKEDLFNFDLKTKKLKSTDKSENLLLIIGHLNELEAMTQLDEIMKKPQPDYFYWQKRKKSALIGIIDKTIEIPRGGDLVLEKINQKEYRTWILNSKGRKLTKSKFFKKVLKPKIIDYSKKPNVKKMLLDPELLAEAVEWSWQNNHKIWNELAEKCLGCGICTYVCPLCHCFSVEDRVSLDNSKCVRCRQWDACTLPQFSQITGGPASPPASPNRGESQGGPASPPASPNRGESQGGPASPPASPNRGESQGGHNFHKTIKERYYSWYYHKFVRAYREFGKAQCVGCGNCARNCPAGIELKEVLKEIVKDYEKSI